MLLLKIALLVVLFIWIIATIVAYGYGLIGRRMQRQQKLVAVTQALPPLSVVITAHNQAAALRRHLPAILEQDYDRFEVIVVNTSSTDDTKDVLERFELQYAHLHHTFTPQSARDISLERLALTLGIRAAAYDWVVITHADCEPASVQWLQRIGETIVEPRRSIQSRRLKEPDIVVGQALFAESRHAWHDRKVGLYRLWTDMSAIDHILRGYAAIRADGCNLAYRKDYFLERNGFSEHQNLEMGAEELLVNFNSTRSNTALVLSPSATVIQDPLPAQRVWKSRRIYDRETRCHQRHAWLYRMRQNLRLMMPWLLLLAIAACPLLPLLTGVEVDATTQIVAISTLGVLLLVYIGIKLSSFNITARALGYRARHLSFLLFELRLPFMNLHDAIAHRRASRNEFRKKFV